MPLPMGGETVIKVKPLDNDSYSVEISDNGIGIENSWALKRTGPNEHNSKGMEITIERLELWCRKIGGRFSFDIQQMHKPNGDSAGTCVSLTLPLHLAHGAVV
jgi:hypothetical protein